MTSRKMRASISDFVESCLMGEIVNRCPMCGAFEEASVTFTNHHINGDPSVSEYWNLIRICAPCHESINDHKVPERKVRQVKRDLFRQYIGAAAHDILMTAYEHGETTAPHALMRTLMRMDLVESFAPIAVKPSTLAAGSLLILVSPKGRDLVEKLGLNTEHRPL